MGAIAHITPKLKRLVLLLSSDQPGEIVAAANAIGRTLQSAGLSWHDLAASISAPPKNSFDKKSKPSWRGMVAECLRHEDQFNSREQTFLNDLTDWRGKLSPKQFGWLTGLYERVREDA